MALRDTPVLTEWNEVRANRWTRVMYLAWAVALGWFVANVPDIRTRVAVHWPSVGAVGISLALTILAAGLNGWATRTWRVWMRIHRAAKLAAYDADLRHQGADQPSMTRGARIKSWIVAPIAEEAFFRWGAVFLVPDWSRALLVGGVGSVLWGASHWYQVRPRSFVVRVQMLLCSGAWAYIIPLIVVYTIYHNLWLALSASIVTHFLHNFLFSLSSRYRAWIALDCPI